MATKPAPRPAPVAPAAVQAAPASAPAPAPAPVQEPVQEPVAQAPAPAPAPAKESEIEMVQVLPAHPYPVFIPTQQVRLSPSNPRKVVKDKWVASQIAQGVLRVI